MIDKIKIDKEKLKRKPKVGEEQDNPEKEPEPVSAGPIDKVIELAFNPSKDKIREVTIIDRMQGKLLPQLDLVALQWDAVIEIAVYRRNSLEYKKVFERERPVHPDLLGEFMYRTAQWQKSVEGKNLERLTDLALAETEARAGEDEGFSSNNWDE